LDRIWTPVAVGEHFSFSPKKLHPPMSSTYECMEKRENFISDGGDEHIKYCGFTEGNCLSFDVRCVTHTHTHKLREGKGRNFWLDLGMKMKMSMNTVLYAFWAERKSHVI
jgi:hypothetical protein